MEIQTKLLRTLSTGDVFIHRDMSGTETTFVMWDRNGSILDSVAYEVIPYVELCDIENVSLSLDQIFELCLTITEHQDLTITIPLDVPPFKFEKVQVYEITRKKKVSYWE